MQTEVFTKLLNLTSSLGGDIVFTPMISSSKGLITTQTMEYTAEEMEELLHLAEKNNIRVRFTPFQTKGGIEYRSEELRIGIRAEMGFNEYVESIAHELAHYFLHFDKGDTIRSDRHAEYEEQADRAAKMLLAALSVGGAE